MPTVTVRTMFELARIVGRPTLQLAVPGGATVRTVLEELAARHEGLGGLLFDQGTGGLRSYLFVELNGRDIRSLEGLETPVGEGDALSVLIPVAGGCGDGSRARARPAAEEGAMEAAVILFTMAGNADGDRAREFLKAKEIAFEERDVGKDAQASAELYLLARRIFVPTLVIGGKAFCGFAINQAKIEKALAEAKGA